MRPASSPGRMLRDSLSTAARLLQRRGLEEQSQLPIDPPSGAPLASQNAARAGAKFTALPRRPKAIAVTCSDSRFISGAWMGLELCEFTSSLPRSENSSQNKVLNDGMLKILCLDVEKVLAWNCSNCLNDDLNAANGKKPCPSHRRQWYRRTLKSVLRLCRALKAGTAVQMLSWFRPKNTPVPYRRAAARLGSRSRRFWLPPPKVPCGSVGGSKQHQGATRTVPECGSDSDERRKRPKRVRRFAAGRLCNWRRKRMVNVSAPRAGRKKEVAIVKAARPR